MELQASLPTLEDDVYLAVRFPTGSAVPCTCYSKVGLSCELEFSSSKPISISDYIIVCDENSTVRYEYTNLGIYYNICHVIYTSTIGSGYLLQLLRTIAHLLCTHFLLNIITLLQLN